MSQSAQLTCLAGPSGDCGTVSRFTSQISDCSREGEQQGMAEEVQSCPLYFLSAFSSPWAPLSESFLSRSLSRTEHRGICSAVLGVCSPLTPLMTAEPADCEEPAGTLARLDERREDASLCGQILTLHSSPKGVSGPQLFLSLSQQAPFGCRQGFVSWKRLFPYPRQGLGSPLGPLSGATRHCLSISLMDAATLLCHLSPVPPEGL